jgi:hypothetical protein
MALSLANPEGKGPQILSWRTTPELDVSGFNVVLSGREGGRVQLNRSLLPCQECTTGPGASYTFRLSGRGRRYNIYVELVHANGRVDRFGPATGP